MTTLTPSVYDNIPNADYHADPCERPSLSSSIAKILLGQSARHAWAAHPRLNPNQKPKTKAVFDVGHATHHLILGDPGQYVIIDADDYRKAEPRELRDKAYEDGKVPLLAGQWDAVQAMAKACRLQLDAHHEASDAFTNGVPERTIIWAEGDVLCRMRIDWAHSDQPLMDDLKTTGGSAEPDAWTRHAFNMGYDIQDAFYRRGYRAAYGQDATMRFIVIETEYPHALSVVQFDEHARRLADQKVERAIAIWRHCMKTGEWPGYPSRIAHVQAPGYHALQWDERVEREEMTGGVRAYLDRYALHWKPIELNEAAE